MSFQFLVIREHITRAVKKWNSAALLAAYGFFGNIREIIKYNELCQVLYLEKIILIQSIYSTNSAAKANLSEILLLPFSNLHDWLSCHLVWPLSFRVRKQQTIEVPDRVFTKRKQNANENGMVTKSVTQSIGYIHTVTLWKLIFMIDDFPIMSC